MNLKTWLVFGREPVVAGGGYPVACCVIRSTDGERDVLAAHPNAINPLRILTTDSRTARRVWRERNPQYARQPRRA